MFIIGFPRSGTKLLRDLLNNHSKINIPDIETNFLPYMNQLVNTTKNLEDKKNFRIVHKRFKNRVIRVLWEYFIFPFKLKKLKIDILTYFQFLLKI